MNELAKSIADLINSLNSGAKGAADAFARVAPEAWHALVRRVQVEAALQAACFIALSALCGYLALWFRRAALDCARRKPYYDQSEDVGFRWVGFGVCASAAVIFASVLLCGVLPDLLAPEVTAAERLLWAVRP